MDKPRLIQNYLSKISHLFLDTAPIIYYLEANSQYLPVVDVIFEQLNQGAFIAVTSPVMLVECLVLPYRLQRPELKSMFVHFITQGKNVIHISINHMIAEQAAELRARYHLSLTDAFQIASALAVSCNAFLTNDIALKRVTELPILVLNDLSNA
jgi:predicted nucleic acid-binding protein